MIDPEKEAERLLGEVEKQYPPEKCSLEEYRDVLDNLWHAVKERIEQLDDEIGDDD